MPVAAIFLDTNIFLRHLRNDHPQWSPACRQLFRNIEEGKLTAYTTDLAIAEIVYVLESKKHYNQRREAIAQALHPLISLRNLKIEHKQLYPRIFAIYTSYPKLSYIDCYHAALAEARQSELYSYDTDFDDLGTLTRKTPSAEE